MQCEHEIEILNFVCWTDVRWLLLKTYNFNFHYVWTSIIYTFLLQITSPARNSSSVFISSAGFSGPLILSGRLTHSAAQTEYALLSQTDKTDRKRAPKWFSILPHPSGNDRLRSHSFHFLQSPVDVVVIAGAAAVASREAISAAAPLIICFFCSLHFFFTFSFHCVPTFIFMVWPKALCGCGAKISFSVCTLAKWQTKVYDVRSGNENRIENCNQRNAEINWMHKTRHMCGSGVGVRFNLCVVPGICTANLAEFVCV